MIKGHHTGAGIGLIGSGNGDRRMKTYAIELFGESGLFEHDDSLESALEHCGGEATAAVKSRERRWH